VLVQLQYPRDKLIKISKGVIMSKETDSGLSLPPAASARRNKEKDKKLQATVVDPLQRIIEQEGNVTVPSVVLARYLLVKIHLLNDNKAEANKSIAEFAKTVKESQIPIAYALLGCSYQEYDEYLAKDNILSEQAAKLHSESVVQNLDTNSNLGLVREEESKQPSSPTLRVGSTALSKAQTNQPQKG
jgi:hypothetical protein